MKKRRPQEVRTPALRLIAWKIFCVKLQIQREFEWIDRSDDDLREALEDVVSENALLGMGLEDSQLGCREPSCRP